MYVFSVKSNKKHLLISFIILILLFLYLCVSKEVNQFWLDVKYVDIKIILLWCPLCVHKLCDGESVEKKGMWKRLCSLLLFYKN